MNAFAMTISGDRNIARLRAELKRAMEILDGMYKNQKEPVVGIALGRRFEHTTSAGNRAVWTLGMPSQSNYGFRAWCHVDADYGYGFDNGRVAIEAPLDYAAAVHESFGALFDRLLTWSPKLAERLKPLFEAANANAANDP